MNRNKTAATLLLCLCLLAAPFAPAAFADTITLSLSTDHRLSDYKQLTFSEAYASSELFAEGIAWTAKLAIDGAYGTSWQEGVKGYGEGESITAVFAQPQRVDMLCLRLGYSPCYEENGVPKEVEFVFSDGTSASYTFPHDNQDFYVLLSRPVTTDYVKLIIRSAYKGQYNADTCITEIAAYQDTRPDALSAGGGPRLVEMTQGEYREVYSYDREGRLAQTTEYYKDSIQSVTVFRYYPDGGLLEEQYQGAAADVYWHYDSKGTKIEQDDTGGIGSPVYTLSYNGDVLHPEYDAAGHLTRLVISGGEGATRYERVFRYEYDAQGRLTGFRAGDYLTERVEYKPDGSFIRTRENRDMELSITELFNADGLLVEQDYLRSGSASKTSCAYDAQGNLIRQTRLYDGVQYVSEWSYDAHGNPTAEWSDGRQISSYENRYDSSGNLLQTVRTAAGTSTTTTYRYE